MLSAVAARRARLQSQTLTEPVPQSTSSPTTAPTPEPTSKKAASSPINPAKPSSKRKSSNQGTPGAGRKKSKKTKTGRYFVAPQVGKDEFKTQNSFINIHADDSDDSMDSDIDDSAEVDVMPEPVASVRAPKGIPASVPLVQDSSDEDGSEEEFVDEALADMPLASLVPPAPAVVQASPVLSTFRSVPDENTFPLSSSEYEALGISGERAVILVLSPCETLALLGAYSFTVLRGSVTINGVTLHPSKISHRVFAPRSAPIPILEAVAKRGESSTHPRLATFPARVAESVGQHDSVVILQELEPGVEGLGRVVRTFESSFKCTRKEEDEEGSDLGLAGVRLLCHQSRDIQPFCLPHTWETAMSSSAPSSRGDSAASLAVPTASLVKGPKNSGKSTFARTLLNRLLTRYQRVAFLECDLGQSEFTPAGMVALNIVGNLIFGPPFTHPSIPHQAHYIGSTSPRSSPSHYLQTIQSLMQTYHLDIQHATTFSDCSDTNDSRISDIIPLVVNTMGWTKGLGADLAQKLEDIIEPTHIFEIEAPTPIDHRWYMPPQSEVLAQHGLGFGDSEVARRVLEPISSPVLSTRFAAADYRNLSIMSYLHAVFRSAPSSQSSTSSLIATSWNTALPLCAQLPYTLDCDTALDRVYLMGAGSEDVVPSEVLRVLNGAIVALVRSDDNTGDVDGGVDPISPDSDIEMPHIDVKYIQGCPPPSPLASSCIGLALIRAVSPASSASSNSSPAHTPTRLQLLTPVPPHLLANHRILVKGELELPVWGMLDFRTEGGRGDGGVAGVERERVPYLRWGRGGDGAIGGEKRRVRRNLMRRGQM